MSRRPTWSEVRQFCLRQGFAYTATHHDYYEKEIAPGFTAKTRISHGKDADTVSVNLWKLVWHEQLRLRSEDDFWRGLDGAPFSYDLPPTSSPPEPFPGYLLRHLREHLHLSEDEAAQVSREDAQRQFDEWCSRNL